MAGVCCDSHHQGWEEDPTNPFFSNWALGSWKHVPVSWSAAVQPLRVRNSGHQLGGVLLPSTYTLTHSLGYLIGSGIVWFVGESFTVAGPVDGVAPGLGVAPLVVTECYWSFSLFGMVVLGLIRGHMDMRVGKLQALHCSSAAPSDHLRQLVKLVGNCSELPRSSWLMRMNHTSFCAGLLGKHAMVDTCGECEHLLVCVGALLSQVWLTPFPGISYWCSYSQGQLEE